MYIVKIPAISKEELKKRYETIKPIITIENQKYYLREFKENELTSISYIDNIEQDKRGLVDMNDLVALYEKDFECLHKYEYYGLFKPSIAEVLAQIPIEDVKNVNAFEIINKPVTTADMYKNKIVFDNGFHISTVRLYVSRKKS